MRWTAALTRAARLSGVLKKATCGQSRLLVVNDDICNAATDIVVSSDDNYFTAWDGFANAPQASAGVVPMRQERTA